MKGINRMEFNTATMIKIIQHYADTVLFANKQKQEITYFDKGRINNVGGVCNTFIVKMQPAEEEEGVEAINESE